MRAYKADLIAEQNGVLETRRDAACTELRETRDATYRELLADQKEIRAGLSWRQEAGFDCTHFLKMVEDGGFGKTSDSLSNFRDVGNEITQPVAERVGNTEAERSPSMSMPTQRECTGMRSGLDVSANIAGGIASGIGSVANSLADSFSGPRAPRQRQPVERQKPDAFEEAAAAARRRYEHADDDAERRNRQQERYWE